MNPINKILLGAGAGAVLAIAGVIMWLSLANAHLRVELAEAQKSISTYEVVNDEFRQKTELQNRAVEMLKSENLAQKRLAASSKQQAKIFRAKAAKILVSKPGGDDCTAASELFDRYITGLK